VKLPDKAVLADEIAAAAEAAGLTALPAGAAERFSAYFGLLQRWNAKLNLTSIRGPEEVLRRHFVESIFCAQSLPSGIATLLDYGSGAGFPGIPIALCHPEIRVTLAESQGKKASFLREAIRTLRLEAEVYSGRVEQMPVERLFDAVALRAVDGMREAVGVAARRVLLGGWLVLMVGAGDIALPGEYAGRETAIPGSDRGRVILAQRGDVPRGTVN